MGRHGAPDHRKLTHHPAARPPPRPGEERPPLVPLFEAQHQSAERSALGQKIQPLWVEPEAKKLENPNFITRGTLAERALRDRTLVPGQQPISAARPCRAQKTEPQPRTRRQRIGSAIDGDAQRPPERAARPDGRS